MSQVTCPNRNWICKHANNSLRPPPPSPFPTVSAQWYFLFVLFFFTIQIWQITGALYRSVLPSVVWRSNESVAFFFFSSTAVPPACSLELVGGQYEYICICFINLVICWWKREKEGSCFKSVYRLLQIPSDQWLSDSNDDVWIYEYVSILARKWPRLHTRFLRIIFECRAYVFSAWTVAH